MITSHLKASYLYRFITKDEKNQVFLFTHGETEEILFKVMNKTVPRRYKVMNKTTFSKNKVVKLYDTTKEAIMQDLNSVDFFASTADMWSSHGLTPYMGHTLNWIDSEWNLRCRKLGLFPKTTYR